MQALDLQIRVHGWALVQVAGDGNSWCYTVGLLESYGHPELVLFDVRTERQAAVVRPLVDLVIRDGALPPAHLAATGLRAADVHRDHLTGELFGRWAGRYGELPQPGDMIHVRLPDSAYCRCHAATVRRLDLPGPLPPLPTVPVPRNRAERRRGGKRPGP